MDKQLEELRKIYLKQQLPEYLDRHGLADVRYKLDERKKPSVLPAFQRFSMAFMVVLLLLFAFLVNITENSHPGNALYPVKKFSSDVMGKLDHGATVPPVSSPSANISSPSSTPKIRPNTTPKPSPTDEKSVNFSQFLLHPESDHSQVKGDSIQLPFQEVQNSNNNGDHGDSNHNSNGQSQKKGDKKD